MRSEPRVNAQEVKSMAALRQDADFLSGDEIREANGALGELLRLLFVVAVGLLGERLQDLLFEPLVGGSFRRRRLGAPPAGDTTDPGAPRDGD